MADKTKETIKTLVMLIGMIAICASPIIAVTLGRQGSVEARADAREAKQEAAFARNMAEQNAREMAFFKGEVNAKLDNLTKGQDRTLEFISNLERAD